MIIIVMGVSGSGKTVVGAGLASDLGWPFFDGDDFHPQRNVDKMAQGLPLSDDDRHPWLAALRQHLVHLIAGNQSAIVTCSALKQSYRDHLCGGLHHVHFVYLQGSYDLIKARLDQRKGHFMPPHLLASQFDTLEEPVDALTVDISAPLPTIMQVIKDALDVV